MSRVDAKRDYIREREAARTRRGRTIAGVNGKNLGRDGVELSCTSSKYVCCIRDGAWARFVTILRIRV